MLQSDMQLAFWLRGLMELCIYPPKPGSAAGEPLSIFSEKPWLRSQPRI